MKVFLQALVVLLLGVLPAAAADAPKPPGDLMKGERLFNNNCAQCHGVGAKGTPQGPPFLDKIYEPNHHADIAFYRAALYSLAAEAGRHLLGLVCSTPCPLLGPPSPPQNGGSFNDIEHRLPFSNFLTGFPTTVRGTRKHAGRSGGCSPHTPRIVLKRR